MKYAAHPKVETNLRCGKCGKPICPKCMVQTPVGARCRECARLNKLPTYRVSAIYYLRACGAAFVTAVVSGIIWGALAGVLPFFYFNLILAPAAGYAIGEVTSLAVNRKRGTWLAVIAGVGMAISYMANIFTWGLPFGLLHIFLDIAAVAIGIFVAVNRLR